MKRRTLNASRLQAEVGRRLHKLQEVIDDGVKFVVPRPQLQSADRTGCNWTMKHFGNAAGFESTIADVLAQVQAEYNLAADDEVVEDTAGDPFDGAKPSKAADPFGESAGPSKNANPFGEGETQSSKTNPFGDAKAAKPGDPFGGDEPLPNAAKRRANPFGDGS
jgi:hypothetical protein